MKIDVNFGVFISPDLQLSDGFQILPCVDSVSAEASAGQLADFELWLVQALD